MSWILDQMVQIWGNNASWSLDKNNNPHEAGFLKLDCSKASKTVMESKMGFKIHFRIDY